MIKTTFTGQTTKQRVLWGTMLCLALLSVAVALRDVVLLNPQQLLILLVSIAVASLINQHKFRIPRVGADFSAKEMSLYFGAVWLGAPGAVLMSAAASAARFAFGERSAYRRSLNLFVNVIASLAAVKAFYASFAYLSNGNVLTANDASYAALAVGAGALGIIHFLVSGTLHFAVSLVDSGDRPADPPGSMIVLKLIPYAINVGGFLLVHSLFAEFGLAFGWVVMAVALVGHLGYRIHSGRLEQKVKEIREASRIHLATVEALATAIDARDQVGRGHVRRTQIYAVGIGKMMGLPDNEIQALRTGALLHDIGKLAVPDHILNKPGRLTPAETEKIKIHSSVGASILEKIPFNYPVLPTIKHHHESWDGSGYPDNLKGKEIPLTARILAVADAYDTLRGARPYRPAVTRDEARKFLINGAGTQFDPTIIDIFFRNLPEFDEMIKAEGLSYDFDQQTANDTPIIATSHEEAKGYIEQIKRANREVFTLYELARTFSSTLSLENIYKLFAEKIRQLVPFDTCVIYLLNEITDEAHAVYTEGKNEDELKNIFVKPGEGGTGFALKRRKASISTTPSLDFSFVQGNITQDYTAMASLPLIAKEKLLGAISIYSTRLTTYEDEHVRLLETVSRIASDAMLKSISHAETESRALTDAMTGLPNARSLQLHFEKEAARADRSNTKFQVLMLDLDGFKAVNDTFGHKVGDKLLQEVSKVMRGQLRDYDFLARYAGDEFVAIIPETEERSVPELCQRIESAIRNFVLPVGDGRFARVGISVGSAAYSPNSVVMLDQILMAADKAMYHVKMQRRQARLAAGARAAEEQENPMVRDSRPTAPPTANPHPVVPQPVVPQSAPAASAEPVPVNPEDVMVDFHDDGLVVELDESHIISSAVN